MRGKIMRAKDELSWKREAQAWTLSLAHRGWYVAVKVTENLQGGFNWTWNAERAAPSGPAMGVARHARFDWSRTLRSAKNGAVRSVRKWIDGADKHE